MGESLPGELRLAREVAAPIGVGFRTDWIGPTLFISVLTVFLSIWHYEVCRSLTAAWVLLLASMGLVSLGWGGILMRCYPAWLRSGEALGVRFVTGYLLANTVLFALCMTLPCSMMMDVEIVGAAGLALGGMWCVTPRTRGCFAEDAPDLAALVISCAGAALWCVDALHPIEVTGGATTFRLWKDCFFHAREISMFAQAHGLGSIPNLLLSGEPTPLYHYAGYVAPGALSNWLGASAFEMLTSFQMPFGILLGGLGAYALGGAAWGKWPGVAGTVAVVLLPDAYQQGFGNKFLSYQFHEQAAVTAGYGLACMALGWMFTVDGCKNAKRGSVLLGYVFAAICVAYKAHLFVANACLILIYPAFFFAGLKMSSRALIGALLASLFLYVVSVSQRVGGVPTLRLDGSYAKVYSGILLYSYDTGFWKRFFLWALGGQTGMSLDARLGAMILVSTFGLWLLACPAAWLMLRKRAHPAVLFLPLFVVANYVLMGVGLAGDASGKWNAEELLNRPLIWAYFAVAAWTGAGLYAALVGSGGPKGTAGRVVAFACAAGCMAWPMRLAPKLQTMPAWSSSADWKIFNTAPTAAVEACKYIRTHSVASDVVQDSECDPTLMVTGLSERQEFVATPGKDGEGARRREELSKLAGMTDERRIDAFAARHRIGWFLLRPETRVSWPDATLQKTVFQSGGYRVLRLLR